MFRIVVIGGSAGSIDVLKGILAGLPKDFAAAVLVVVHIGSMRSVLPDLLDGDSSLPVRYASQGQPIAPGHVLVAPSDLNRLVAHDDGRPYARLVYGPKENHCRPAIDPLFRSAASIYRADATAVLLSGFLDDGTVGIQAIKAYGGIAVVQDPATAEVPDMPASAVANAAVDFVLHADRIAAKLVDIVGNPRSIAATATGVALEAIQGQVPLEDQMLADKSDVEDINSIGTLVPLTCPECHGTLWEVRSSSPPRYRCHTGHAFTANVLSELQHRTVEDALWAAVRALHEKEQLYRRLHEALSRGAPGAVSVEYEAKVKQAKEQARVLRHLIASMTSAPSY